MGGLGAGPALPPMARSLGRHSPCPCPCPRRQRQHHHQAPAGAAPPGQAVPGGTGKDTHVVADESCARCGLMKPSPRKLLLTLQDPLDIHLLSTALAESPGHGLWVQPQAPEAQWAGLQDRGPDGVLGRVGSGSACGVHAAGGEAASGCSTQNSQLSSAQSRETWPPARPLGLVPSCEETVPPEGHLRVA